jgi:hypothetical protein
MVEFMIQLPLYLFKQALQNQKKKNEEEKAATAQVNRDFKYLSETCDDLQKKTAKLQQDLAAKDGHIINLEGLVARNKHVQDGEHENKVLYCSNLTVRVLNTAFIYKLCISVECVLTNCMLEC